MWISTKAKPEELGFRLGEDIPIRWDPRHGNCSVTVTDPAFDISPFEGLFVAAYNAASDGN
jgi:hypothetical protein